MGLEITVTGAVMGHQIEEIKYFGKRRYEKEQYAEFSVDLRKSGGLVNLFSAVGKWFDEDCFYVRKEQILVLMNEKLQTNPFDYQTDSDNTVDYFLLMHHLEKHRYMIESKSKDDFVLVFELSY